MENSQLSTRCQKTDTPVDLSHIVKQHLSTVAATTNPTITSERERDKNLTPFQSDLSADDGGKKTATQSSSSYFFSGRYTAVIPVRPEPAESETNLNLVSHKDKPTMILSVYNLP